MHSFKDTEGRDWKIAVNVGSLARVKALTEAKVDLLTILDDDAKLLVRLHEDLYLLVEVGWALCKPEADARNVTTEQFASALGGDALEAMSTAIMDDLTDFFPQRKRESFRKILNKMREVGNEAQNLAAIRLDEELAKVDVASAAKTVIDSFGKSLGKSV